jgi:threonine dehydrogenase-like Zn-dependent dehydrogenase
VADPGIEHPRDAIIKVTSCAICGSDRHLYDGFMPGIKSGDIMGHEFNAEHADFGVRGARHRRLSLCVAKPAMRATGLESRKLV